MAIGGFFAILDDITALLNKVSVLTKVAATKTTGLVSDDLAVSANMLSSLRAHREIPIVMAIAKGSLINKVIIIVGALALSAIAPWLITPILIVGGLYLAYEGAEKVLSLFHKKKVSADLDVSKEYTEQELLSLEADKIKGAIRTDFVLSLEIMVIALSSFTDATFIEKVLGLCLVGIGMTILVYGIVAAIIKADDVGFWLLEKPSKSAKIWGQRIIDSVPKAMKVLSFVGTIAMFVVGGGILLHSTAHYLPEFEHFIHKLAHTFGAEFGISALIGLFAGVFLVAFHHIFSFVQKKVKNENAWIG